MSALHIMYIVFTLIGIALLGLSIVGLDSDIEIDFGDPDIDISDAEVSVDSPSMFSFKTLSTFLLIFGIAGNICIYNGYSITTQLVAGFLFGIAFSVLYFLVMKGMYAMQGDSSIETSFLIGKEAIVTTPTVKSGILQVKLIHGGYGNEYTAREINNVQLYQNEKVKIISVNGGFLMVEKVFIQ